MIAEVLRSNDGENRKLGWINASLLAAGIIALYGLVLGSPQSYISDEAWHLNTVGSVHKHGWSTAFFEQWRNATGPMIAWTQWLFEPATQLKLPAARMVNAMLLAVALGLMVLLLRRLTRQWTAGLAGALGMLALAPIWKISGMVYAEIPALVLAMLAISALWRAMNASPTGKYFFAALAGLIMGLAILGRQPFLLAAGMTLPVAALNRKYTACFLVFFLASLPLPLWVFNIWGGLQSPFYRNSLIDPFMMLGFGVAGLGYMGAFAVMLNPGWIFGTSPRRATAWALPGGLIFALLSTWIPFTPLQGVFRQFPPALGQTMRWIVFFVLGGLAISYGRALVSHVWRVRQEGFRAWIAGSLTILSFMPGLIGPLFSTRYLMMTFPFLIIELAGFHRLDRWYPWRCGAGLLLGVLSLWSHLYTRQEPASWDNSMEIFYPHLWRGRPEVFAPVQWEKFDYGHSPFIQNPRWGGAVRHPTDTQTWQWPGE